MFKLVVLGAIVPAWAADVCIAPSMPGPAGCSVCTTERQGGQCVRQGRWFSCSTKIEDCCKNPEVASNKRFEDCVAEFNSPNGVCNRMVANSKATTNDKCMTMCKKGDSDSKKFVEDNCHEEHFDVVNGRVKTTGQCFNGWIHGYSEPQEKAGFKNIDEVDTPAECQRLCQESDECVRFIWYALNIGQGNYSKTHRCTLKNEHQVVGPASIVYTSATNPANYDSDVCNFTMAHECWTNHYQCAPCEDGKKRCIWHSDMHVAGWKYCPDKDMCDKVDTTEAPTTTTPEPTTTTPEPTTTTPEPTTTTPEPTTTTPEPTTTTPEPTTTTPEPTTTTPEPTTTTPEPTTTTPEPTTTTPEPTTTTPEPTTTTPEPTTTTPEPTTTTPEPTTTTPEPTTTTPEPTTTTPEPTTTTPEPTTTTPEPTTTTPEPTTETPEPTTETPEPTTETPEPTTETPEPTTETPEPTTETPEPTFVPIPIIIPPTVPTAEPFVPIPIIFPPTEEPTEFPPTEPTECPTESPDCRPTRPPCDNCEHGIEMKVHEKPKLLRLAIDN